MLYALAQARVCQAVLDHAQRLCERAVERPEPGGEPGPVPEQGSIGTGGGRTCPPASTDADAAVIERRYHWLVGRAAPLPDKCIPRGGASGEVR